MQCDPSVKGADQAKVKIGWVVRSSPCFEEYLGPEVTVSFIFLSQINQSFLILKINRNRNSCHSITTVHCAKWETSDTSPFYT